jgi:aminoglycoside phosphotransferase (APT) family kinase protein
MPAEEVEIDEALVRRLLESQFPQWAGLALRPLPALGWDNRIYRLGPDLVVRLPRRQLGADLIVNEHRFLPELSKSLPVPTPVPLGQGRPAEGYPWPWSVCPWIPGVMAAEAPLADETAVAEDLGRFIAALHHPAPSDCPHNPYRSVPLSGRDALTRSALSELAGTVDTTRAAAVWSEALTVAPWTGPPLWLHGDLHPANLLVKDARLSGVIDFGDLCGGDPAVDLVSAWMLFSPTARKRFAATVAVDSNTWQRGRAWALAISLACIANSADNPLIASVGRRGVEAVLQEA